MNFTLVWMLTASQALSPRQPIMLAQAVASGFTPQA